ncbi:hypothetical protein [Geminicoccus flavidas]|uniref:hypothetical protein n=1 Tax=Geminicoccus flavidas TaxID=2506407 RepID=UPI00135964CB|nr:hypothetical protein [Geminicoccus flavidas]
MPAPQADGGLFWVTLTQAARPACTRQVGSRSLYLLAPLSGHGRLDPLGWQAQRGGCPVLRISCGQPILIGALRHRAGGAEGSTWIIDYDPSADAEEGYGYRLDAQRLVKDELVPLVGPDGVRTFQVADISSRIPTVVRRYLLMVSRPLPAWPERRRACMPRRPAADCPCHVRASRA